VQADEAGGQGQQQVHIQVKMPPIGKPARRKLTRRRLVIAALVTGALVAGGVTLLALRTKGGSGNASSGPDIPIVYWSPDGNYVAFCWSDGKISLLEVKSATFLSSFNLAPSSDSGDGIHPQMCWSPDSKQLAFDYTNAPAQIWDVAHRKVMLTYPAGADTPIAGGLSPSTAGLVWSPDGRYIAWAGLNVDIWSATSLDNIVGLPISENDTVASLAWASDSRRLAVALENSSTVDITVIRARKPLCFNQGMKRRSFCGRDGKPWIA
jgi:WD40 repeat protein